jgi:hypothetical protein
MHTLGECCSRTYRNTSKKTHPNYLIGYLKAHESSGQKYRFLLNFIASSLSAAAHLQSLGALRVLPHQQLGFSSLGNSHLFKQESLLSSLREFHRHNDMRTRSLITKSVAVQLTVSERVTMGTIKERRMHIYAHTSPGI